MNDELMPLELEQEMEEVAIAINHLVRDKLKLTRSKSAAAMMMVIMRTYEENPTPEFRDKLINLFNGVSTMLETGQQFFDESALQ